MVSEQIGRELLYESGAILQTLLERFAKQNVAPVPNTPKHGEVSVGPSYQDAGLQSKIWAL